MILQPGWWWLVVVRADQRIWSQFPALPFSARHSPSPSTARRQTPQTRRCEAEMEDRDMECGLVMCTWAILKLSFVDTLDTLFKQ